jgi:HlyD family secretion protein
MVPAGRPVAALLPPGNLKVRFYVPESMLPRMAYGDVVKVGCDGCAGDLTARVSFIASAAEFTPPVIYSRDERSKLVFLVEALPEKPQQFRVGQPIEVAIADVRRDDGAHKADDSSTNLLSVLLRPLSSIWPVKEAKR